MSDEKKLESKHLKTGVKTRFDEAANLKWRIEHSNCPTAYTHIKSDDGTPLTLFFCERHPTSDILVTKGHLRRVP